MTGARAFLQNLRIDPLPIIAYPQAKQVRIILNGSFDAAGPGMLERVSQHLLRNPVDLVLEQRRQDSRLPFDGHLESGDAAAYVLSVPEFPAGEVEQDFEAAFRRSGSQVLDRVTTLSDGPVSARDCGIERLDGVLGTPRKEIPGRLKLVHQPLKTLQQRIVQLACDTTARPGALPGGR